MIEKVRNVFLSHATPDRQSARKLTDLLSRVPGVRVFATEMLVAGGDWRSELRGELSNCDLFVFFLSSESVDSPWILAEIGAAWAMEKPIVAVVTDSGLLSKIPIDLRDTPTVSYADLEKPDAVNRILEAHVRTAEAPARN
jgi:TIR domain-containing protein